MTFKINKEIENNLASNGFVYLKAYYENNEIICEDIPYSSVIEDNDAICDLADELNIVSNDFQSLAEQITTLSRELDCLVGIEEMECDEGEDE